MGTEQAIAMIMVGGTIGSSFAIGWIASSGLKAIGRNPDAASSIQTNMILGVAFAEALAIYCLVVSLILKFV